MPFFLPACAPAQPVPTCPADEDAPADSATLPDTDTAPADSGETVVTDATGTWVLSGQSNMDGYAYLSGLPPSLQLPQQDLRMYWSGNARWTALGPASFGTASYGEEYFGPEVTFARTLADAGQPVEVIKHAVGGTSLAAYWYPGLTADDAAKGQGYTDLLATVEAAMPDATSPLAGVLWMQGESDASEEAWMADAYADNLELFIHRLREDLGAGDLPFVLGAIHCPTCPYRETVRDAQAAVASGVANVTLVETEDLPVNVDDIHYDGSGMRTLGERFAAAATGTTAQPETPNPAFELGSSYLSAYSGDFFVGYAFTLDRAVRVTDLGTLDYGLDGLYDDAQVALFEGTTGDLLARATVPSTKAAPTSPWSWWRFVAIEPVSLPAGDYSIAVQSFAGSNDRYIHDADVEVADGVTWIEGRHNAGGNVTAPTTVTTDKSACWFGPNFLFVEE